MSEALIAYLRSLLDLSPKQGWIFLLIGSAMLLLVHLEIIPREEIAVGWLALFWLATVSGAIILIVNAGAVIWRTVSEARASKAAAQAAKRDEEDAVRSAEILNGHHAALLLLILTKGEKRISEMDVYSLSKKSIIKRVGDPRSGVFEVVDSVWNERERLIPHLRARANELRW